MKALKIIGIILLALILIGGVVVSMQPSQGHVEKSIVINASPAAVYRELNSFKSFQQWAPWAKMDPNAKFTFEGPESGPGAKLIWEGEKIGKGSQWIEESVENQSIKCALAFEGVDGKSHAAFFLSPEGNGTKLVWTYDGENNGLSGKAMWMVMGSMLDGQYEQGLNDVKAFIESQPAPADSVNMN